MKPIECEILVQAPVKQVFSVFTDLHHAAERCRGIEQIEILSGPGAAGKDDAIGRGTVWRETRIMMGKRATEDMTVVEFTPPEFMRVTAESHGCKYDTAFYFEPDDPGPDQPSAEPATRVRMTFAGEGQTLVAKLMGVLMAPMMKGMIKRCFNEDLEDLKKAAEGASASAA